MSVSYAEALTLIGGLSQPSKMPWYGWSISAKNCITGAKLAAVEGTVCSTCYALKGRYTFPNVQGAMARREAGLTDPRFVDAFVLVLDTLYAKTKKRMSDGRVENRFRWFDSGDLQSVDMLCAIVEIARRTPQIDHWLPTRELGILRQFEGSYASNIQVRVSTAKVGVTPRRRAFKLPMSTVGAEAAPGVHQCPAAGQGNRCADCNACWRNMDINYVLH